MGLAASISNAQTVDWVLPMSSIGEDMATVVGTGTDGSIYTAGSFNGTMTLGEGVGTVTLTSAGSTDAFLARYNASGDLTWAFKIGGTDSDEIFDLAVGDNGVYVTGYFRSTMDADPGPGVVELAAGNDKDILLAKYDLNGLLVWAHGIGSPGWADEGSAIALDGAENVWVSGSIRGMIDMDPGPGVFEIGGAQYNRTFLAKYSADGQFIWAGSMGFHLVNFPQRTSGLAVDGDDNVIITGRSEGIQDFDPGPGEYLLDNDSNSVSVFLAKFGPDGSLHWAHALPGVPKRYRSAVAVDAQGNVYTSASFNGDFDLDPGPGEDIRSSFSIGLLTYILKLDAQGQYVWAVDLGSMSGAATTTSMTLDAYGNIHMTGNFTGTQDLDPGPGTHLITSASNNYGDGFILSLDPTGGLLQAGNITSPEGWNSGLSIAVDGSNDLFVAGYFRGTADLDPFIGQQNLSSAGERDGFLLKIGMSLLTNVSGGAPEAETMILYPVPARDELSVSGNTERTHVRIHDITGRCVLETVLEGTGSSLDVSDFPSGMYFFKTNRSVMRFLVE